MRIKGKDEEQEEGMTIVTGDRYLDLLSTFIEDNTGPLLDGALLLKLNPVGLHYVQTRLEALEELEALRVGAPVDYLRAYVADLGDHRALEQLRRVLRLLSSVKVVAMIPPPFRDPTPITLIPFSSLRFLELRGCDLSTSAARGLLELRPILETLVCFNSADALRHIFAERTKEIQGAPVWSRLADISCFGNGMLLMDESLQLLPAVEALDLSRNRFARLANLQKCTKLKYLDAGYNNITTVASLNKILRSVTRLVLRNNALVSTRGLHRINSLEALDLSYNLVSSFREIELLGELPSLRFLWLEGNPITFGRSYRREVLSYFPDPMKIVLDGKQTSMWESWAARRIVARRLKQRSKYGAFTPAQTCESSHLPPQLSDVENLDDITKRVESNASAGPSSVSSTLPARKKNSRLACIVDVTGMNGVSRTIESPRGNPSNPSASFDSASPVQSAGESKEQIEETVQDLIQQAEILKKSGAACWLKDLNALLQDEGKGKAQMRAKIETSLQSSLVKRRRRRSMRKESLGEPSTSDRSNMSEESEKLEKNVARLTQEVSTGRMGKDALSRLGSGGSVNSVDEYLKAANLGPSTSLEDVQRPFVDDAVGPSSSLGIPDNLYDGISLKVDEPSGNLGLAEELLIRKMSIGSSSSPPQFNQALLRRREILERELLLLSPEIDIFPFSDSDTSSGTIYSHLSDSSDSSIHRPSAVWHPYRFGHGENTEIPSAQGERSDSEDAFQVWSDTETQEEYALEKGGSDVKDSSGEGPQHSGKAMAPTSYTAEGKKPAIEDTALQAHPTESKEPVVEYVASEQGRDAVEGDSAFVIEYRGQKEADEARSGQCEISSSSIKDGPMVQVKVIQEKEKRGGDEEQLNLASTSILEPKSKSFRRIVHLDSLSGITESSEGIEPSSSGGYGSGNDVQTFGVKTDPGQVLGRSVSSSGQFSQPFNISRSSSVDANLERQQEWSRRRSHEDALTSTSLQQDESHEARDNSLQFHRVHHVVGPFVGQCA